jgi:hypothetical protein
MCIRDRYLTMGRIMSERVLQGRKKMPRKNLIYRVFLSGHGDFATSIFVSTVVKMQQNFVLLPLGSHHLEKYFLSSSRFFSKKNPLTTGSESDFCQRIHKPSV